MLARCQVAQKDLPGVLHGLDVDVVPTIWRGVRMPVHAAVERVAPPVRAVLLDREDGHWCRPDLAELAMAPCPEDEVLVVLHEERSALMPVVSPRHLVLARAV